jgi:hypothetical protein
MRAAIVICACLCSTLTAVAEEVQLLSDCPGRGCPSSGRYLFFHEPGRGLYVPPEDEGKAEQLKPTVGAKDQFEWPEAKYCITYAGVCELVRRQKARTQCSCAAQNGRVDPGFASERRRLAPVLP